MGIDRRSARKVERPQADLENRASGFVNHAFVQSVVTIGRQAAEGVALRARLDSTTNWAVVTTGIALSATFSSAEASPLSMVLVGIIVSVFLLFEARRYRYFNVWRARARLLETDFYAPMIRGEGVQLGSGWAELLAKDYCNPRYHISFARAIGRRLRRAYAWIFVIQAIAYYGKLAIHPTSLATLADLWERAAINYTPQPVPKTLTTDNHQRVRI